MSPVERPFHKTAPGRKFAADKGVLRQVVFFATTKGAAYRRLRVQRFRACFWTPCPKGRILAYGKQGMSARNLQLLGQA